MVVLVKLWGETMGGIAWDDTKQVGLFEFDREFWEKRQNISPITMPYQAGRQPIVFSFPALNKDTYYGLPGILADALPDKYGNRLIDAWLALQGRDANSFNPVERLSYMGKRAMGALEFEPATKTNETQSQKLEIAHLVELASQAIQEKEQLTTNLSNDEQTALQQIIKIGTSAGGARAKAIVAFNEKTKEVRSGQVDVTEGFEHWIIKFDGVTNKLLSDPQGYGRIEYAYYLMAKAAGIQIMPSQLLEENGRAHFMTKRFDRIGANGKIHAQTLCGIAHFDYNSPNTYSYEQAFQVMRTLRLPYTDAEELFKRMIFNIITRNQDDHTKNISFLMNTQNQWRLSPAYDLTFAYDPTNKWMFQHQLSVNGKRQQIELQDILELAKEMNIKKPKDCIAEVQASVVNWREYAALAKMPEDQTNYISNQHLQFNL